MITYVKDDKEAIITSIADNQWTISVYNDFESYRTCQAPLETYALNNNPNKEYISNLFPGWEKRVRDNNSWQIIDNSTEDLPDLPSIPKQISARQIRLWLVQHNFPLSQIDIAIDAIADPLVKETVKIEWEYAPYIERTHPWLVPLAQSLGLNEEQIDQAFREASTI